MRRLFPPTFYNPVTLTGAAIAVVSFGLILFLMLLEATTSQHAPYVGVIAFVILPVFLILGLLLIALGIIREHRLELKGRALEHKLPRIDLNDPRQRRAATVFTVGTILLLLFSAFGSFKAYQYTDSDQFCGQMCHKVMKPEYTAYQSSPHAHVGCVQCHIGPGADWFVRSKLSGSYQVYATIFNKYPRPIPTPIKNLRPAQQTCEQCHWPKFFYHEMEQVNTYFMSDSQNTRWTLNLLLKVGGGNSETGPTSGIHWHMNIANVITYATLDTQRQIIPWVQVKSKLGNYERTYRSTEATLSDSDLARAEKRRMDCIDCHNRPTHIYHPPAKSVNDFMALGRIDPSLPFIKTVGVNALDAPYTSTAVALDSIRVAVEAYYDTNYPGLAKMRKSTIDSAIATLRMIYSNNYFPEMGVRWQKYPNNLGHLNYPGCFRCHDGKHVSDDGMTLTKDCNTCHTILAQHFDNGTQRVSLTGLEYTHPVDIGGAWKDTNCDECHNSQ
jgi:nitrate/TMAO reductase-like tetraheme cytochrome c subunit